MGISSNQAAALAPAHPQRPANHVDIVGGNSADSQTDELLVRHLDAYARRMRRSVRVATLQTPDYRHRPPSFSPSPALARTQ